MKYCDLFTEKSGSSRFDNVPCEDKREYVVSFTLVSREYRFHVCRPHAEEWARWASECLVPITINPPLSAASAR